MLLPTLVSDYLPTPASLRFWPSPWRVAGCAMIVVTKWKNAKASLENLQHKEGILCFCSASVIFTLLFFLLLFFNNVSVILQVLTYTVAVILAQWAPQYFKGDPSADTSCPQNRILCVQITKMDCKTQYGTQNRILCVQITKTDCKTVWQHLQPGFHENQILVFNKLDYESSVKLLWMNLSAHFNQ